MFGGKSKHRFTVFVTPMGMLGIYLARQSRMVTG